MLPRALLSSSLALEADAVRPRYLGPRDEAWLARLLELYASFEGRRRKRLHERLGDPSLLRAPKGPSRIARHVLDRVTRARVEAGVSPEVARAVVFRHAARERDRLAALASASSELELEVDALEDVLFADLRSAERVGALPLGLSPKRLAGSSNLALASALLARARSVRVAAFGGAESVARHAQRVGLICSASALEEGGLELEISGAFALFRHTLIYGRRLASLLGPLSGCERFELEAWVVLGPTPARTLFRLSSKDPLPPASRREGDQAALRRFAQGFARLGSAWQLVPEPEPLRLGLGRLAFPDFAAVRAGREAELIEVVGFWTERYLLDKLASLREAGVKRFVLCVDERRACRDDVLPEAPELLLFRGRLDPARVLARLEEGV